MTVGWQLCRIKEFGYDISPDISLWNRGVHPGYLYSTIDGLVWHLISIVPEPFPSHGQYNKPATIPVPMMQPSILGSVSRGRDWFQPRMA